MRTSVWILFFSLHTETTNTITSSNDVIAFTVRQNTTLTSNISNTLSFQEALTNAGNAVLNSGVFNCTKPGLYEFHVHAMSDIGKASFLDLYLDDQMVATLRDNDVEYSTSVSGNTAILKLEEGNTVQVKTRDKTDVYVGVGKAPEYYTLFTGVYLGSPDGTNGTNTEALFVALDTDIDIEGKRTVPIEYKKVVLDTANGYDSVNSLYRVQSDGIYIIHFFSFSDTIFFDPSLVYNGNTVVASSNTRRSQSGNTVILEMKTNDSLSVRMDYVFGFGYLKGSLTDLYSTLTVLKLFDGDPASDSSFVGFTDTSQLNNNRVVFTTIYYNFNNVYNKNTGEFLVPLNGFYQFNFHVMLSVYDEGVIYLTLYHNEKKITSTVENYKYHTYSASTLILQANANDTIYIQASGQGTLLGYGRLSTFSGHLLRTV